MVTAHQATQGSVSKLGQLMSDVRSKTEQLELDRDTIKVG
jgi:hypothetical protein